ncbi:MAG: metallophosphoesterase [Methanobacterium sp.]|nr:metallophosphoesterase [Methanobacterium sp.]
MRPTHGRIQATQFFMFLIINYVIFYGFSFTFDIPKTFSYYILLLIVALALPISQVLLKFSSNILVRSLYAASAFWLGMSAYLLILFAIYLITGFFIQIPAQIAGILILTSALVISLYASFNTIRLEIEQLNIPLLGLKDDIRAVQISDLHLGPIRKFGFIKKMVNKIIYLNPEIVFITGDLFDGSAKLPDDILKDFNRIKVPIIFIMGNHDFYQGLNEVSHFMSTTPIKILNNQTVEFKGLQIIGVPFYWDSEYLEETLKNIDYDQDKPTLLLYHVPIEFKTATNAGIDLQLSGHTHAGQFLPFSYFIKLMFPYNRGLYEYNGSFLYVSQGTGTLLPPMRLGSRCEITLINLTVEKP